MYGMRLHVLWCMCRCVYTHVCMCVLSVLCVSNDWVRVFYVCLIACLFRAQCGEHLHGCGKESICPQLTEANISHLSRLKEALRQKLVECGWQDQLKAFCKGTLCTILRHFPPNHGAVSCFAFSSSQATAHPFFCMGFHMLDCI